MSATKKQSITLMRIIGIIFAILIVLGFVALLMNSAESASRATPESIHGSNSAITIAAQDHEARNNI